MPVYLNTDGYNYSAERGGLVFDCFFQGQRLDCVVPVDLIAEMSGVPNDENSWWQYRTYINSNKEAFERAAQKRVSLYGSPPSIVRLANSDFK